MKNEMQQMLLRTTKNSKTNIWERLKKKQKKN